MSHANPNRQIATLLLALLAASGAALAGERTAIVSASKLPDSWSPAPGAEAAVPAYPSIVADKTETACVTVGFLIKPDGSTGDASLLKSWSARHGDDDSNADFIDPFARNAIAAVERWRFVPAKGKPRQTYTSASFAFSAGAGVDQGSLRAHCEIDNLSAFIAKVQAENYRRGDLKKGEMERDRARVRQLPSPGGKVN